MSHVVVLRDSAKKDLKKLPTIVQFRILKKLKYFSLQTDPLAFAKKLQGPKVGVIYRYRVGTYRVLFLLTNTKIIVIRIDHRKDIYK